MEQILVIVPTPGEIILFDEEFDTADDDYPLNVEITNF